jgi:ubiquinone biosynthesis protein UbiJ
MSQEKVFHESLKLWEQFASNYADMMTKAIEQSIRQSETFKSRVDDLREQMLKAWQLPGQPEHKALVEVIQKLQEQVEHLASRVESLERAIGQEKQKSSERS